MGYHDGAIESGQQVSWNAAQSLLFEMATLRTRANNFYLIGNYTKAFEVLKCVKMLVIQSFNDGERKELALHEQIFYQSLHFYKLCHPIGFEDEFAAPLEIKKQKLSDTTRQKILSEAMKVRDNYDSYSTLMSDFLERYGYLVPVKKNSNIMNF